MVTPYNYACWAGHEALIMCGQLRVASNNKCIDAQHRIAVTLTVTKNYAFTPPVASMRSSFVLVLVKHSKLISIHTLQRGTLQGNFLDEGRELQRGRVC
jgi:hypothetical protein